MSPILRPAQQQALGAWLDAAPGLEELARRFEAAGWEVALVGGAVRDLVTETDVDGSRPAPIPVDIDLTTNAHPHVVQQLVAGWATAVWDVGIAFGTVGATYGAVQYEITTYRTELYSEDSRKPEVAYGTSLEDDLLRRDFRVNAMAVRLPSREFVDPFDGLADLAEGVLRTPGSPADSFGDDPLRIMRAARFISQLSFSVAPDVVASATQMSDRIAIVSAER
ncbi:MAG: CCA tRNA nucleotidyltransferase, partial [Actinomycetes bacterium]